MFFDCWFVAFSVGFPFSVGVPFKRSFSHVLLIAFVLLDIPVIVSIEYV